jgi:hypothetical protein
MTVVHKCVQLYKFLRNPDLVRVFESTVSSFFWLGHSQPYDHIQNCGLLYPFSLLSLLFRCYFVFTSIMVVTKEVIEPGDGVNFPQKGDRLTMHYHGTLASNGQKFDASRDRGRPFQFQIGVGQVIRGWDEGVAQM